LKRRLTKFEAWLLDGYVSELLHGMQPGQALPAVVAVLMMSDTELREALNQHADRMAALHDEQAAVYKERRAPS